MESVDRSCEWLQANRYGSFAMGSIDRIPRRKYHSLLCIREPGIGDPLNTILDVGEYIESDETLFMLHSFDFGNRVEPKGFTHLKNFQFRPFPIWDYEVNGTHVQRSVQMDHERDAVRIHYVFSKVKSPLRIRLRPFVLSRPFHELTQANPFLNGGAVQQGDTYKFGFYQDNPSILMRVVGALAQYSPKGEWVEKLHYSQEKERGYPFIEDTYVPGEFALELTKDTEFYFEIGRELIGDPKLAFAKAPAPDLRYSLTGKLEWAAEQYLLTTRKGFNSIIAGYPWFGDWGRDTFISLAGMCIENGELDKADKILSGYADKLVEGLTKQGIVCAFPETGLIMTGIDTPLLFIRAVQQLRERSQPEGFRKFMPIVCKILNALRNGADKRVHVSIDGGLFVEPGPWAVTWMDVLLNGQPVTSRSGFAVDTNALFYNALNFAMDWASVNDQEFVQQWSDVLEKAEAGFQKRFWSDQYGFLADSNDGTSADFSLRPNQLWAIALPYSPLSRDQGAKVLDAIRKDLVTPVGLRTLSPKDPKYIGTYRGAQSDRDRAYHQGTVWPWLLGIYADAMTKIHGASAMKAELRPVVERLAVHLEYEGCLGHISEVFDGDAPHAHGGTPAQAWSTAEVLRVVRGMQL